jgi:hypothetical protein
MLLDPSCIASPWHQWLCTYFGVALDCQWPIWEALYWNTRCKPVREALFREILELQPYIPGWSAYPAVDSGRLIWSTQKDYFEVYRALDHGLGIFLKIDHKFAHCAIIRDGWITLTEGCGGSEHRAPLAQGLGQLERVVRHFWSLV